MPAAASARCALLGLHESVFPVELLGYIGWTPWAPAPAPAIAKGIWLVSLYQLWCGV